MPNVSDLMTDIPMTVTAETPIRHVIEVMKTESCRQLPVIQDKSLVGIVTDRDVRLALNSPIILHGKWQDEELMDSITAGHCMTPDPLTIKPNSPAVEAAELLLKYKFGALPVLDEGDLVGIISVSDFLEYFVTEHSELQ